MRPCALLRTQVDGDEFMFHERSDAGFWAESFPGLVEAVHTGPRNILPHRLKPPQVRGKPEPEPERGAEYWRERASKSLSTLITLTDVKAPPSVIEQTREMVRQRMAKLEPGDAAAVLRAWPRAARLLEKEEAPEGPTRDDEKPN